MKQNKESISWCKRKTVVTFPPPATTGKGFEEWERDDYMVMTWL